MSSTPVTRRPASRPAAASQSTRPAPKAAPPPTPAKKTLTADDYRRQREASDFQRAVAALPAPGPGNETILSSRGAKTLEQVQKLLSGVVTDGNAKEALAALQCLEPRDFTLVMEKLGSSGELASLLDNLPTGGRSQFLSVAAEKGWLSCEAGKKPASSRFDPPASPALYKMERRLPSCVNDAIFAESKASAAKYKRDYDAYLGRYESAVKATTTKEELAALGHPVTPSTDRLNIEYGVPDAQAYRSRFGNDYPTRSGAYRAVSEQVAKLTGQRHDGAAWLEANLEVAQKNGAVLEATANDQGVETRGGVTASGEAGPLEARVKQYTNGEESAKVGVGPVEVELKGNDRGITEGTVKAQVGPVVGEVGLDRDGKATLGVGLKAGHGPSSVEGSVFTTANPKAAEMTAGVSGEVKVNGHEVKVKVSVGYKGTPRSTTREVVNGRSVFDR